MDLNTLTTAADLENNGVWLNYDDARFLIGASGRPAYTRALQRHATKFPQRKLARDTEVQETVALETMADAVLLDFTGIEFDGKALDGKSRTDRLRVLAIRPLRDWIAAEAANLENFQRAEAAAEVDALKSDAAMAACEQ